MSLVPKTPFRLKNSIFCDQIYQQSRIIAIVPILSNKKGNFAFRRSPAYLQIEKTICKLFKIFLLLTSTGCAKKPPIFECGSILLTHDGLAKCWCHYIVYSLQSIRKQLDV